MNKIVLDEKTAPLFRYYHGKLFVRFDIQPEFKDETKFKNSAFVKTGRKVPTGRYNAFEKLVYSGNFRNLSFYNIKSIVLSAIDEDIKNEILRGFVWNGFRVWLSQENQQNYSSWATALKTNPDILPLTAKFNDAKTGAIVYYKFGKVQEFEDFYAKSIKHINNAINLGRKLKDNFNNSLELYKNSYNILLNGE